MSDGWGADAEEGEKKRTLRPSIPDRHPIHHSIAGNSEGRFFAVSAVGRARLPRCAFEQMWCGGRRLLPQLVARRSCSCAAAAAFNSTPPRLKKRIVF